MIIRPPKEIMKYVSFKDGTVIAKEDMPQEFKVLFVEYKNKYEAAKQHESDKLDKIVIHD